MLIESVGAKVLAGTLVEIIKRTGLKIIEEKQSFSFHQEIHSTISKYLTDNESSGLHSYMELLSTKNYIHNFLKLLPFQDFNHISLKNFVTTEEFILLLTDGSIQHMTSCNYNIPDRRAIEKFFTELLILLQRNLILNIPDEMSIIPRIIIQNIEQLLLAYQESGASSESLIINFEDKRVEYLNSAKHIFTKNHVPGIDILDFEDYYIYPTFEYFFNDENESDDDFFDFVNFELNQEIVNWKDIFLKSNLISIVGGPGYGKTLFLKNLVVNSVNLNINNPEKYLPIYCNLKEFGEKKKKFKGFSFKDFLVESIVEHTGIKVEIEMIDYFLNRGECLIYLDALDEVESSEREKFSKIIIGFYNNINSNNKLCITTRDRSLIPDTPTILKVRNIEIEDVERYLELMIKINQFREVDTFHFINQIGPLIDKDFVVNFLTVALMVNIYKADRKIPENKIDLFDKCVNYTAKDREREKNVEYDFEKMGSIINNDITFEKLADLSKRNNKEISREMIVSSLSEVFKDEYRDKNDTNNAINHFLNFCKERTELYIQGSKENYFKFFHRSFFEFFYAKYLVKNLTGSVAIFNELHKFSSDSELHELLMAYLKTYNYNRYQKLIDTVLEKFDKLADIRTTQLAVDMVQISDQFSHKKKMYHILFHKDRISDIKGQVNFSAVLDLMVIFDDFTEIIITKYSTQLIQAVIYLFSNSSDHDYFVGHLQDPLTKALIKSEEIINVNNKNIVDYFESLTFEEFIEKSCRISFIEMTDEEVKFTDLKPDSQEMIQIHKVITDKGFISKLQFGISYMTS